MPVKITVDCNELPSTTPVVQDLVVAALAFMRTTPFKAVSLDRQGGPTSTTYRYFLDLVDGRTWTQDMTFDGSDPSMTFSITGSWRLSEFVLHRTLRDTFVRARVQNPTLVKLEVKVQ